MPEVTYGRLDEVLRALGFTARMAEENARVYKHDATRALIVRCSRPMRRCCRSTWPASA